VNRVCLVFECNFLASSHPRRLDRIYISKLKYIAVDEADTMLAKDFKTDLLQILDPVRQSANAGTRTASFVFAAATLSKLLIEEIDSLFPVRSLHLKLKRFRWLKILQKTLRFATSSVHKVSNTIRQEFIRCDADKTKVLLRLLRQLPQSAKVMVFCNTLDSCRFVDKFLRENAFDIALVHGGVPPRLRKQEFQKFMSGQVKILVCSDVAARGLDTTDVNHVILFDFPRNVVDYIHRVGRTARAGRSGVAFSLVRKRELPLVEAIQQSIKEGTPLDGVGRATAAAPATSSIT
jgi:superfamily II DNA/RNA helicase